MPDTDRDWRKWGRCNPYFAVLTSPEFSQENIAENKGAFFRTGEQFVDDAFAEFARFTADARRGRVLDYGCGTGRLTIPLSYHFREVVALDISPAMLGEAETNASAVQRTNITFRTADDRLSQATGLFDLVVSHLVLQHIPVRRGLVIFEELINRLAPGGLFYISVSIRNDTGPLRWLYWASATIPGVKVIQNLLRGAEWNAPAMQMNDYPLDRLVADLSKRGVQRLSLIVDAPHPRFQTVSLLGMLPTA
jgi:SAM-dependent methyltransferase